MTVSRLLRRACLPLVVFLVTVGGHLGYHLAASGTAPGQDRWAPVPTTGGQGRLSLYLDSQSYFLGLSYASSLAFAAFAYRRFRERRASADRALAVGGLTISGILAVAGCFLMGCCGSPMLSVYISLLGPWFLPWRGPFTLILTLASLAAGWWWLQRKERGNAVTDTAACREGACGPACGPGPAVAAQRAGTGASRSRGAFRENVN